MVGTAAVLEDVMLSEAQRKAGLDRLRRVLTPGGVPLPVVGQRELVVIDSADFLTEWRDCEANAKTTPEAIEAFLDLVEVEMSEGDDDTFWRLGPEQYAFCVEADEHTGCDPLSGIQPDIDTGTANALARFDILN